MNNKTRTDIIREKLETAFQPSKLEVIDDSAQHVGHAGASTGAGHFTVKIKAGTFEGKSLVAAHQMVYQQLNDMIGPDIHALSINIL